MNRIFSIFCVFLPIDFQNLVSTEKGRYSYLCEKFFIKLLNKFNSPLPINMTLLDILIDH